MSYMLQDLTGLALATLLAPLILYLPGLGLVRLLSRTGLAEEGYWPQIGWAMLLGLSILPVFDTLAIRMAGMPSMLLLNGALALWGLPLLQAPRGKASSLVPFILSALLWWLICAWSFVDVDIGAELYQSLLDFDMVKHAVVIEQISRHGIPFSDPFFARDGIAGYYHYFYIWPAAIRWIGDAFIDARMAFGGAAFWTGFGFISLIWRISTDAGFIRPGRSRRVILLAIAFCYIAGADLLFMLLRYISIQRVVPAIDSWNTELRMPATAFLWVPHHISSMIAAWTGMMLSAQAAEKSPRQSLWLSVAAASAFATMFGESTWMAIAISPLLMVWTLIKLRRGDWTLLLAGIGATILSAPQIDDIIRGRAHENFPIVFGIRRFTSTYPDETSLEKFCNFALLPLNYGLELGIFAFGTYIYWRMFKKDTGKGKTIRALLLWSTLVPLFVASFLRANIIYNDLGVRAVFFIVLATSVWTLRSAQSVRSIWQLGALPQILLLLGSLGTAWDIVGLRLIREPWFPVEPVETNNSPPTSYALRTAYGWANKNLPDNALIQHNPAITQRSLDFGLYSHHWPAIADEQAHLFGSGAQATAARMRLVKPIFAGPLSARSIAQRARSSRIDYLLFASRDPVWRLHGGPPLPCIYRSALVCIAPVPKDARS